jgi:hypothetical protein
MANTSPALRDTPPAQPVVPPQGPFAVPGDPVSAGDLEAAGVGSSPIGAPGDAPSGGPVGSPSPTPTPTPTPSPTPTPTPTPSGEGEEGGETATGDGFAQTAGASLLEMLKNATSPEALEAQNIILRRIALQGDVIPSRVPPPRNITEIGGYLNLLTNLNELDMRSQVLAGILGVAGPNPPLGHAGVPTPLSYTALANDRPPGPVQPSLPVTVLVRSDLAGPLKAAISQLHDRDAQLPLLPGPYALPPLGGPLTMPLDPLDYIGRTLRLSAASALVDPASDAIALVRLAGSSDPFAIAVRSNGGGTVEVTATDYEALQLGPMGIGTVPLTGARFVMLAPVLAAAGFAPGGGPIAAPEDADPPTWAKWTNVAGLAIGTALGEELRLLHSRTEISASALAAQTNWRWNGTEFAP